MSEVKEDVESKKTMIYVGIGLVALLFGIEPWRGMGTTAPVEKYEGKMLFDKLESPLQVKGMEIVQYDPDTSEVHPFNIAVVNGRWTLPSKQNYPADAKDHLSAAANALIGVEILNLVTNNKSEHAMYGVVEPPKQREAGLKGVGTHVILKGDSDKVLADVIIGKATKENPQLRYVRKDGKDAVFLAKVSTDKFATKFEDWIEKDLLKLSGFDVRKITIHDYSSGIKLTPKGFALTRDRRMDATLDYDDAKNAWTLGELLDHQGNVAKRYEMKEDEELNAEKLSALKTALGDLKIVDVERKPDILSQNLKSDEDLTAAFQKDPETANALVDKGFIPTRGEDDKVKIMSSEGDVTVTLKDGVEYVLRFGEIGNNQSTSSEKSDAEKVDAEKTADDKKEGEEGEDKKISSLRPNRYVYVSAQYNPDVIPKPSLEELPPLDKPAGEKTEGDKPAADKAKTDKPAADKPAAEKAAEKDAKPMSDEERKIIEGENQIKEKAYEEKVKAAKERVTDLNDRFADWFYVVSDDVYRKIRLSHEDLIHTKKKPAGEGTGVQDLDALKKQLGR